MSRHEFIETLQTALGRSLAPSLVADHIKYYEEYIRTRMSSGESEREVLRSLGDPRLIARTIIETNARAEGADSSSGNAYQEAQYSESTYRESYSSGGYRDASVTRGNGQRDVRVFRQIPDWLIWVLIIGIVVLVLGLVLSVVSFLAPLLVPFLVIVFLVKLFRDWLN